MTKEDLRGVAIHCQTKEESQRCCNLAHELGWEYYCGTSYLDETQWMDDKYETAYDFARGYRGNRLFYIQKGYEIKSAEWFLDNFKEKKI